MNKIIQWFVENSVAANLAMMVIFIGGGIAVFKMNKEAFPAANTGIIEISAPYPGAGPKEVEEQILIRIEEAIGDLDGIDQISSTARLGSGSVQVEAVQDYDVQKLLNNIQARIDSITTLPDDAERIQVREVQFRQQIMNIAVYGDVEEIALKQAAQHLRDELAILPNINLAELQAVRSDEMTIEVSEQTLRHYNLTFNQVVNAIRSSSVNLPAGTIKSSGGDLQLQTRGQAYYAEDFESIIIDSNRDGVMLRLGDIATIKDGFEESEFVALLNGQPAVYINLFITDNPNVLKAREQVYAYLQDLQGNLPPGIKVSLWNDQTIMFEDRMNLLLKNAISGLLLVFVVLMLFLRPVLAWWVCVGIAIAFLGTLWFMPYLGVSLNMISLFGFLLVLGIVVDDAIIVGESIYSQHERGMQGMAGAAGGAKAVHKPVFFAVISTMVFFSPMLFVPGSMGTMAAPIAIIVILCLAFSLIESLLILPSHLSHLKEEKPSRFALLQKLGRARQKTSDSLMWVVQWVYSPLLEKALKNTSATLACFAVAFFLALAVFAGGWLRVRFMPVIQSDQIRAEVVLAEGVPFTDTQAVVARMNQAVESLRSDPALRERNNATDFVDNVQTWARGNRVTYTLALQSPDQRELSTQEVVRLLRAEIGDIPEAEEVRLGFTINNRSAAIRLRTSITSDLQEDQERAVAAVKAAIARYPGTQDIKDDLQTPRDEIQLTLKKHAETLGLTLNDIARQVRQGFYGEEVQRIPRAKEDVRVMVRFSEQERRNVDQLREMRIRAQDGREVPLMAVADIEFVPSYSVIRRLDRKRTIVVTAELQDGYNANEIVRDLLANNVEQWQQQFPGFTLGIDGDMRMQMEFLDSLVKNFLFSLLIIYGLFAIAFRSYWQPIIVLTAIPFGFMGAVIGHLIMGREVSMMSMLGFVACAGVVVNDNLVLLDRISALRKQGHSVYAAVVEGGRNRFRAIVLTSLTTFIGLTPILAETSMQARFLIPMVISLAFGVIFATTVTLILVPTLYLMGERLNEKWRGFFAIKTDSLQQIQS